MNLFKRNLLVALVLPERLVLAESAADGSVARTATLTLPQGKGAAEKAGDALRLLLANNGFTARRAVVALPASALTILRKQVPSVLAEEIRGIVANEAQFYFSLPREKLLVDYRVTGQANGQSDLIVFGAQREKADFAIAYLERAGVKTVGVTPAAYAFFMGFAARKQDGIVLLENAGLLDCCALRGGALAISRTLPLGFAGDGKSLSPALAGALATFAAQAAGLFKDGAKPEVSVYAEPAVCRAVKEALAGADNWGTVAGEELTTSEAEKLLALAVADSATEKGGRLVNFLQPELARGGSRFSRTKALRWGAVAAAILAFAVGAYVYLLSREATVAELEAQIALIKPAADVAGNAKNILDASAPWGRSRVGYNALLEALTRCFPDSDGIWVNNLSVKGGAQAIVTGKADSREKVIALLDAVKKSPACADVNLLYIRSGDKDQRDNAFSIRFKFNGKGK